MISTHTKDFWKTIAEERKKMGSKILLTSWKNKRDLSD
jgi:hypothetical protein